MYSDSPSARKNKSFEVVDSLFAESLAQSISAADTAAERAAICLMSALPMRLTSLAFSESIAASSLSVCGELKYMKSLALSAFRKRRQPLVLKLSAEMEKSDGASAILAAALADDFRVSGFL